MPSGRLQPRTPEGARQSWPRRLIERRLGGYRQLVNRIDPSRPVRAAPGHRVAVIGGGIAGMSAAVNLSERGFEVTLMERSRYLGGKVGSWPVTFADGATFQVEHGFHAFFRNYYNLRNLLEKAGVDRHYGEIDDYVILPRAGEARAFRAVDRTPVVNLLSLARHGIYRLRDLPLGPAILEMLALLRYDEAKTFAQYDDMSFTEFAERARLKPDLRMAFTTFARAIFTQEDQASMAEMMKSFHFYYLSQDHGLIYDYLDGDYERTLNQPLHRLLVGHGARVLLGQEVDRIERRGAGFGVLGEEYGAVVLASDVIGSRRIGEASSFLRAEAPSLAAQLAGLRPSQPYAVLRLWVDRPFKHPLPAFVFTERIKLLDSVTSYDRIELESASFAAERGGAVIELHCYALPDGVTAEAEIRQQLITELEAFFPAMRSCTILYEHLQVRRDFPAFHVGMHRDRPSYRTEVSGLYLAGDWVRLPYPAMLMEAACMSGLLCANAIFARDGLREEPVFSVPLKGIFA